MNIFYIDTCPVKAAQMQCDKHVVKMVLESAQMLCAAHHVLEGGAPVPYKLAHKNHPSTVWVRSNSKHYDWLYRHFMALSDEYTERYGRVHLAWEKCHTVLMFPPMSIPDIEWTDPPQCMPDECKRETSLAGYTEYYFNYKPLVIDMRWPSHRQPTMERNYATA